MPPQLFEIPGAEKRFFNAPELRIEQGEDGTPVIEGYAAVFNTIAHGERIAPGAFAKSLRESKDIRALWNHDTNLVLGRTTNNTLELREDDRGLYVRFTPPNTTWANDAREMIRGGYVSQMSFAMNIPRGGDRVDVIDGQKVRTILEAELFEVSPVTFPWYETTSVSARCAENEAQITDAHQRLARRIALAELE